MTVPYDIVVLGGGPAGSSAAIQAAKLGLRVALLDENDAAGGQVYRAPPEQFSTLAPDHDVALGEETRRQLADSNVDCFFRHRVWHIEPGWALSSIGPKQPQSFKARALIVATGAIERHVPIEGWTLPGVVGLAAATVLLKAQKILPGRRVVVAGAGPMLPLVATMIAKAGGKVACIVDANGKSDWLRSLPALMSQPPLLARGAGWVARIVSDGIPVLSRHALRRIEGTEGVERVVAAPITANWDFASGRERVFEADAVCYGFGLMAGTDVTRLLGVSHIFDEGSGWIPRTKADTSTGVPSLYVCGDAAGICGALAAPLHGHIAALAAARDLGLSAAQFADAAAPLQAAHAKAARFGLQMTKLAAPRKGLARALTADTIVCRCENVTRRDIDKALAAGSVTVNGLKSVTRCGMGPCGGRVCEDAVARLIADATDHSREQIGYATGRPPLRPIPLDALTGAFDYDSLPFPESAPL